MSTVAQVIDRVLRDWLYPPDDQPTVCKLSAQLTAGATSLTYDPALLSPEESDLLGPGTLLEIESEQLRVGAVNETTNTLSSLVRGVNGTTDATHANGSQVIVTPTWPRKTVFDAVADSVEQLFPELFAVGRTGALSLSSSSYVEVDASVMSPLWLWARPSGFDDYDRYAVTFLDEFPPVASLKAIYGGIDGSGYLVYKKRFTRPSAESDSMATLGLEDEWEQLVIISVVSYLISGRDLSHVAGDYITDQLGAQAFPIHSGKSMREGLIRYREFLIDKAKRALRNRYPAMVTTAAVV